MDFPQSPKEINLQGQTLSLLDQVDEQVKALNELRPFSADVQSRLRTEFLPDRVTATLNMEGIIATRRQTLAIMDAMTVVESSSKTDTEIRNALAADEFVFEQATESEALTPMFIREINRLISLEVRNDAGEFRTSDVEITGAAFIPPSHIEVPSLISKLCDLYTLGDLVHPIVHAAWVHDQFGFIHPFHDGNGRTGRLLQDFTLIRRGLLPTGIPSSLRDDYYGFLEAADKGEWDDLIQLVAGLELSVISKTLAVARERKERTSWINNLAKAAAARQNDTAHKQFLVWQQRVNLLTSTTAQAISELDEATSVIGAVARKFDAIDFTTWQQIRKHGSATRTWISSILFFVEGEPAYKVILFARRHVDQASQHFAHGGNHVAIAITGQDARSEDRPDFYRFQDREVRLREIVWVDDEMIAFYGNGEDQSWTCETGKTLETLVQDLCEDVFSRKYGIL